MTSLVSKKTHITIRWAALLVAFTATAASLLQAANINRVYADDGGYPWVGATCIDGTDCSGTYNWGYTLTYGQCPVADTSCLTYPYPSVPPYTAGMGDPWGYGVRNCTSYAAWKVNQTENADIHGWGQAYLWATNAPITEVHAASGYTPQIGDIAQWNATGSNQYGHVAYVFAVNGSTASFYEYNSGYPKNGSSFQWGLFYSGFTSANYPAGGPNNYIHVGTVSSPSSRPSAVTRDSSDMDTFYQNGSNLDDRYWNSTNGWNSTYWGVNIASSPAGIARDSSDMDTFFRDGNNNLVDQHWNSSTGWATTTLTSSGTVRGNPTVISRNSGSMEVFYRDSSGNLVDWYWNSSVGWNSAYWADNLKGDPAAFYRDANNTDVFYRDTSNNLGVEAWNSVTGWSATGVVTNGTIGSDPGVVSPDSNHMDAFYKDGSSGNLYDRWWTSTSGWNTTSWSVAIGGTPDAVSRNSGSMEVFVRSNGNNLVDQWWTSTLGWNTTTLDSSGTLTTDPSAIYRDSTDTDSFYGTSPANLVDEYWNSSVGWNSTYWGW